MNRLPSVFISHGALTLPIDLSMPSAEFASLAHTLPRPQSILMLSAHWGTSQPVASIADKPETIHDFYGFPRALYELRYPAPGAPDLARRAAVMLGEHGVPSAVTEHGLDHGAWVPLLLMFPDVPTSPSRNCRFSRVSTPRITSPSAARCADCAMTA